MNGVRKRISDEFNISVDELTVRKGERIALIGSNGSGKTTLLRLLAGVIRADEGELVNGFSGSVGYSPQQPYVFRGTVRQNISVGLRERKSDEELNRAVSLCRISELLDREASKLSGGEKQRMFLARMIAGDYRCLLLDEPLSSVDVEMSDYLAGVIADYCRKNEITLIMSTHLPSQASRVADRIVLLNSGRIEECIETAGGTGFASDFGKAFVSQWIL